ncbi:MAG: 2-amino-4-hydroxy-6-hydroxymethyldihydropteridine diphosphokinase [Zoogloeaceae bacterium]|uniref:2-amino-4-hydroxy-6- hydroxymethyldihydropteridine diphosphokinase n=1 Tax=Denitromonas sp. TaxID=2734609 RepID=UPI001D4D98A3|nr:2-amino-4-hydroxy-6-hydroxymethyldihydropteridine diphosphokinase [Rhodocyclaceae bacterium]MCP5220994.1 2-amino-4-hydroxy-6-hydroxymethyldihydropteridine diphosphokinase [Zoogloeaceae bacterium]HPR06410.1 2-amino-4-hydroxy-6-hydroxymethyldihydropteridine diphosphokinase [Denitromonas sp.]
MTSPSTASVNAFIGLGANLGDPVTAIAEACEALAALPDTRFVARSGNYRTAPVGVSGQPDYINAVAQIDTRLSPMALLVALMDIETRHGRTRDFTMAPRTLDLDVLLYGDQQIALPGLHVPHPRMHQRAFVLVPLAELAPTQEIPGIGRVDQLLAAVADQVIAPLPRAT